MRRALEEGRHVTGGEVERRVVLREFGFGRPKEAVVGLAQSTLVRHVPGVWDEGDALEVRLLHGTLSAVTETAVLNGRNLCAIGDGSSDNWELFQFRDAELIGPDTYLLRHRLRGQLGTDALMPDAWPVGSWVVLMNGTPTQIEHLGVLIIALRLVAMQK